MSKKSKNKIIENLLTLTADELNVEFGIVKIDDVVRFNDKLYEHFRKEFIKLHPETNCDGITMNEMVRDSLGFLIDSGKIQVNCLNSK